jgi:iron complex transport system substrate-binding protein
LTRRTLAAGLLFLSGGAAEPAPHRVVSIGACLDPILLALADPGQIAALSHLCWARRTPRPAGRAPSGRCGRRGPSGEALILRMETALAAAAPKPGEPRLRALVYQSGGLAAGPATLLGEMLERCGFENGAARYGLRKWGSVSLERVLADPPQVLLAGARAEGAPTWADRVIDHPALESLRPRTFRAGFPQKLIYCGGPVLIETAKVLAKARRRAEAWARQRSLRD